MDVQLVQRNADLTRKPLAILFELNEETFLKDVRNIIVEQVSDIMPNASYSFLSQGKPVSKVMEEKTTIREIVEKGDDPSLCIAVLSVDLLGDVEETLGHCITIGPQRTCETGETATSTGAMTYSPKSTTSLPAICPSTENRKVLQLRSPTTAELRNLKKYTDDEIIKGKGKEQAYRAFWNKKVEELAKNRSLSKQEIYKRTNEQWRLHGTQLLLKDSEKMKEMEGAANTADREAGVEPQKKKMKAVTLPSNISRAKASSAAVASLLADIAAKTEELKKVSDLTTRKEIQSILQQLRRQLDTSKSEMRKAQDALRKNLNIKKSELSKFFS